MHHLRRWVATESVRDCTMVLILKVLTVNSTSEDVCTLRGSIIIALSVKGSNTLLYVCPMFFLTRVYS